MTGLDGQVWTAFGTHRHISKPERLVFTLQWEGRQHPEMPVSVEFTAQGNSTAVTLTHERFASEEERKSHEEGWTSSLNHLVRLLGGTGMTTSPQQLEANKHLVLEFYDLAFNKKDIPAAVAYLDEHIIQHHPQVTEGKKGSIEAFRFFAKQSPNMQATVKNVIAEGDQVVLHVFMQSDPNNSNDRGAAVVDIFRVENGKIIEHWDVIQPVPEKSANKNTMF